MKPILVFFLICIISSKLYSQDNPQLKSIVAQLDSIDNTYRLDRNRGGHPETYQFRKVESIIDRANEKRPFLTRVESIENESLSEFDQINKEILLLQLRDELAYVDYKRYLVPMNAEGGFYNSPTYFLPRMPFNTVEDFKAYVNWLPGFGDYMQYQRELLETGVKEGILPPKIIIQNNLNLLKIWTDSDLSQNPFYKPLENLPSDLTEEERSDIVNQVTKIITSDIQPEYQKLEKLMSGKYLKAAPEKSGVINISGGREYYENRIRHFTTLDMSPDSVFNLGMFEVRRIKSLMNDIIAELKYEGSFEDFIDFLRTDPRFYAKTGQELLNYAAWLSKKAEGQLPKLFGELYSLPFTVEPVPDAIAPNYTGGRYVPGSRSQNRAGIYWVNTSKLNSRTLYTLPALTLHEAVPGHHLQGALASEIENVPDFRYNYYISAFGEGWGLYSEYLGEEMGMYETPYDMFGRYTYEMWRACRLVVDVGIHYKNWSREEAVKFLSENTALSIHEVNTEIDRYIGWPGQAVSYKVGEITIKKLREEATEALGDKFDIQEFHKVILKNGSVPLTILRKQVESYVKAALKE